MALPPPNITTLFTSGWEFPLGEHDWTGRISINEPVLLHLPTGQVVVCDPFLYAPESDRPLQVSVAPGRYPVTLATATITDPGDPEPATPHLRVAAARLDVLDEAPVTWELALRDGQDPARLGEDEFFGYGVDAGTGCFADASSIGGVADYEDETEALLDAFGDFQVSRGPVSFTTPDGHQIVAFSSGWGDGSYPTWVGYTADGRAASLVTEFFVVPGAQVRAKNRRAD